MSGIYYSKKSPQKPLRNTLESRWISIFKSVSIYFSKYFCQDRNKNFVESEEVDDEMKKNNQKVKEIEKASEVTNVEADGDQPKSKFLVWV